MAQRAVKTHTASLSASIAASMPPIAQNPGAILPKALETPEPKENRSTSGKPVGKPVPDIADAIKTRNVKEASHIAADIFKTAAEEGGRWKKHYLALMHTTAEVRGIVLTMLKDQQKAFSDKVAAETKGNVLGKALTASAYVRISELKTFIKALDKGLTRDTVGEMLVIDGKDMTPEEAQSTQLVAVARQFLSGKAPASRAPAAERLDPEAQFKLALLRAVARKELSPSILTHRWIANHAVKIIDSWVKQGVIKNLSYDNAAKIAASVNADPSAKGAAKKPAVA